MSLQTIRDPSIVFSDFAKILASYIIFTDGIKVYAKNGDTGNIEFIDTDISNLLQKVINTLYSNYSGGKIFIKRGTYYPNKTVNIPDGIKLIIEGEGDVTVFKYTNSFTLFLHQPSSPTWSSVLVFKNFKVDRSGSGSNTANIIYVFYALYDEYDGITIIDDYRNSAEDVGLYGRNSIMSIVHNCRIFNKSAPVYLHSFFVHIYSNYATNTALIGFAGGGLLPYSQFGYQQPPGYPLDGLVIIEDNVCVDCGRTDEAFAVDNESNNLNTYGTGIIRNNMLITQNYSTYNAFSFVNVDKCFVENNIVNSTINNILIQVVMKNTTPSYVSILNNYINATLTANTIPISIYAVDSSIERNYINITVTATGSDIGSINKAFSFVVTNYTIAHNKIIFRYPNATYNQPYFIISLSASSVYIINNDIEVSYPSGYSTLYGIDIEDQPSRSFTFAIIKDNYISFNAGNPLSVSFWGTYTIPPLLEIVNNRFYTGSSRTLFIGLRNNSTVKINVFGNTLEGSITGLNLYTDSGLTPTAKFIHRDMQISSISSGVVVNYINRNSGTATFNGDGTTTQFKIAHGLTSTPSKVLVTPASSNATGSFYVTVDATYIYVNYLTAPPSGTNNVVLSWYAEV